MGQSHEGLIQWEQMAGVCWWSLPWVEEVGWGQFGTFQPLQEKEEAEKSLVRGLI